jgi:GNAT superfamily N-acetyltransferase
VSEPDVEIRGAAPADAAALAQLHVRTWREAYVHLLSARFLADLRADDRLPMWRSLLDDDPGSVHVADAGGELIGFAATRAGAVGPRPLELWGIYLLAEWHGSGVGQRLLDAAVGGRPSFLWVAADNARAHAFCRRNGFVTDGENAVVEAWEGIPEIRFVR